MSNDITVSHNEEKSRFEAEVDGHLGIAEYMLSKPNTIVFTHTEVPKEIEGRGVAGRIVRGGLDYARAQGLDVMPLCPYVAAFIRRHPEYRDLLKAGFNV